MPTPLYDFIHDTRYSDIPKDVRAFARRWILDLSGVAIAGSQTDMSRIMCSHAARQFGAGGSAARMICDGREVSPAGAALAGGIMIDSIDAHDGHKLTKGHVGCGVFPSVLALTDAEALISDQEFLTAIVIGYELGTRSGIALHQTATEYHSSGAWVAPAIAALGARILGLDAAKTREAIGIGDYHGPRSPLMRAVDFPVMVKDGSGWGAMAGVSAAYLAQDGFTGAPALPFEGDNVAELWSDLGDRWRIFEQYYKLYPICRWAQPPVQAALNLRAKYSVTPDAVDHIEVNTFHESLRLGTRHPKTTEQAQYSTAFPTAIAVVRGNVTAEDIKASAFNNPEVLRLADGMIIAEKDEYNAAFPARRIADVTLVMKDGRRLASPPTEALGDPEDPVDMPEVTAKFHALSNPVIGRTKAVALKNAVADLGNGAGLSGLQELLLANIGATASNE